MTLKPSKIQNVIIFWTKAPGLPYIFGWPSCIHNTFLMTGYSQMYKIISFLFLALSLPISLRHWSDGMKDGGWCKYWWGGEMKTSKKKKWAKWIMTKKRQDTCSSSCWTTCICTRHWAVLLSSNACSLFRCLERGDQKETGNTFDKTLWENIELHYLHVQGAGISFTRLENWKWTLRRACLTEK